MLLVYVYINTETKVKRIVCDNIYMVTSLYVRTWSCYNQRASTATPISSSK